MKEDHSAALCENRPTLYSVRNTDRLAEESSRARRKVVTTSTSSHPREFTAYFQSSPKGTPTYAASHTFPEPEAGRMVPAYPMVQSLRWHPYVETSSIEDLSYTDQEPGRNCRCANCTRKSSPKNSRLSSSSTLRFGLNRNNIMTFTDVYTMTPRVTDAGCGSSIVSTTRVSGVSAKSSVAVRDTQASTDNEQVRHPPACCPTLILKDTRRLCPYNDLNPNGTYCSEECDTPRTYSGRERDVLDDCDVPPRVSSIRSFFRSRRKKKEPVSEEYTRSNTNGKLIYNEGISDRALRRCPLLPCAVPSDEDMGESNGAATARSKVALRLYEDEGHQIPHSHRYNVSRYHRNCKHSRSKVYMHDDGLMFRTIPESPRIPPKRVVYKSIKNSYRSPSIKLPKKVLTSDMNIEEYVDTTELPVPVPAPPCARRTHRCL